MAPQQALVRARQSVFRKMSDGLKQGAAELIIKILRVELFLRLSEASAHVGREFANGGVVLRFSLRPAESLRRHKDNWDGTSYGTSVEACRQRYQAPTFSSLMLLLR